jgi:hypothetical protein
VPLRCDKEKPGRAGIDTAWQRASKSPAEGNSRRAFTFKNQRFLYVVSPGDDPVDTVVFGFRESDHE